MEPSVTRARASQLVQVALHAVGWMVVVPLLLVVAARLLAWDTRSVLIVLNALTPMLYLPAWVVAVAAAGARRWPLFIASVLVVVAHLSFALPELAAAQDLPDAVRTAPTFRLFSANVYAANPQVATFAREIGRARPDILLLQEATPTFVAGIEAAGVLADLPYRKSVPRFDPFGAFVASRWPLVGDEVVVVGGRPIAIAATIEFNGTPVRLIAVHTVSPVSGARLEWVAELRHLTAMAAAETGPTLLAGDFNATWGHKAFRRLLDAGLTDAAAARGKPYRMTWTFDRGVTPPLVRIDHVLTKGRRLAVTRISVGQGRGSDHRPLVADVAVLPSPGSR